MSVLERLARFRLVQPQQELPWTVIRAIDASSFAHQEPDLRLLRNMIAFLASSDVRCLSDQSARVPATTTADWHQLVQLMQVAIQFLLYSQDVLKEELLIKQCGSDIRTISSRSLQRAEKQVAQLLAKLTSVTTERDLLGRSVHDLQRVLEQRDLALRLVERQLTELQQNVSRLTAKVNLQAIRSAELQCELAPTHQTATAAHPTYSSTSTSTTSDSPPSSTCRRQVHRIRDKHQHTHNYTRPGVVAATRRSTRAGVV